jgi:hypothetical protein
MHRRDAIRALSAGLALPTVSALTPDGLWAAARSIHDRIRSAPQDQAFLILTDHQNAMITALAELIIPETDTPGATGALVNRFVDVMLAEWFEEDEREEFLRGLVVLDGRSVNTFGVPFLALEEAQQVVLLKGLDAEVAALREANLPTDHFFLRMKWLTLYGYYTSEVGATQELRQVIIPGRYEPCAPAHHGRLGRQGTRGGRAQHARPRGRTVHRPRHRLRRARAWVEPPLSRTRRSEISRAAKASTTDVLCLRQVLRGRRRQPVFHTGRKAVLVDSR